MSRRDNRTVGAALEGCVARIQAQTSHLLLRAVTSLAAGFEDRLNVASKVDFGLLGLNWNNSQREEKS